LRAIYFKILTSAICIACLFYCSAKAKTTIRPAHHSATCSKVTHQALSAQSKSRNPNRKDDKKSALPVIPRITNAISAYPDQDRFYRRDYAPQQSAHKAALAERGLDKIEVNDSVKRLPHRKRVKTPSPE
jgi:hypothetical protein